MRVWIQCLSAVLSLSALAACDGGKMAPADVNEDMTEQGADSPPEEASRAERRNAPVALAEVQIMDQSGFGQPMVAGRAQVPGDWQTRGGVAWDRSTECVANHLRMNWLAASPDGREAIELMPGYSWQVQGTDIQMNPCPPLEIRTTQQFLQMIAQRYPGARVLGYRDRPELVPQQPQQTNGVRAEVVAGELLIAYQSGTVEVHERLTTSLSISEMQGNICISSPVVYSHRVVGAMPDPEVSDRFIRSLKAEAPWLAQVQETSNQLVAQISQRQRQNISAWHNREMARINARGAAERSQIRMQTNREVAQIYSNIWSNSQATDDRIQRRTLESIGGYNTYTDPSSGTAVRGSIEYDRVLRTQSGDYISTNDPNFNPAGSEELERMR